MRASILIADDHAILREAIRSLLAEQQDLEVVGEAGDGRSAVVMAGRLAPRVIIMDIGMPDLNGIEATRQVLAVSPGTRVIALSMHSERDLLAEMLRAGASGYLLKSAAFSELLGAIRTVLDGQVYLSPAVAGAVVDGFVRHVPPPPDAAFSSLSAREREVLQLVAEGHSTKQIAARLYVSVKTVEAHRSAIMETLNIHSIAGLTKYAMCQGLTSP